MPLTPDVIRSRYSKYKGFSDEELWDAINDAEAICPENVWLDDQDQGIRLYVRHLLECEWIQRMQIAGASTAIAQGQPGQVAPGSGDPLDRTVYGQQFRDLRDGKIHRGTTGFVI